MEKEKMFDSLISELPSMESIPNEVASWCSGRASPILLMSSEKEDYCRKLKNADLVTVVLSKFSVRICLRFLFPYKENISVTNNFLDLFCRNFRWRRIIKRCDFGIQVTFSYGAWTFFILIRWTLVLLRYRCWISFRRGKFKPFCY